MRKKRNYQAPLVLTVAALAATACGTSDPTPVDAGGGTGGTTTGGTGGTATGGTVGALPACDTSEFYNIGCRVGARCETVTDCSSGQTERFVFECIQTQNYSDWQLATSDDSSCDKAFEQCSRAGQSGHFTCQDSNWLFSGVGGNPPAPCPQTLPAEGSDCRAGAGFGADPWACGYPCADGGWTVTGCQASGPPDPAALSGSWQSDGACGLGSAGGAGGERN